MPNQTNNLQSDRSIDATRDQTNASYWQRTIDYLWQRRAYYPRFLAMVIVRSFKQLAARCFAEYLVAWALGITGETRIEWDAADLKFRDAKIEVKSAAYLQTWKQEKLSAINLSIRQTTAWDEQTGKFDSELKRQADLYVFCLLAHTDKSTVNPLDTNQWRFFVLPSTAINDQLKDQKTIGLSKLMSLNPTECNFDDLQESIVSLVDQINVPTVTTENTRQDGAAEGDRNKSCRDEYPFAPDER